jgi:hypothetical protein
MKKIALLLFMALSLPLVADEPFVRNSGAVTRVAAGANLRAQIDGVRDGWVGYALPLAEPRSVVCRGYNEWFSDDDVEGRTSTVQLFFRMKEGAIDTMKIAAPLCTLDAGGRPVAWLSAADERAAVTTLIDLARRHKNSDIREKALFWLSQQAGAKAAAALQEAVDDPEESVKARAVFGISQLPDDQSIPLLVKLMKTHRTREVRKKAAFWLGQKRDPRALAAIEDVLLH